MIASAACVEKDRTKRAHEKRSRDRSQPIFFVSFLYNTHSAVAHKS